jgi:hypothetical protein
MLLHKMKALADTASHFPARFAKNAGNGHATGKLVYLRERIL